MKPAKNLFHFCAVLAALLVVPASQGAERTLRAGHATIAVGQTNRIPISLESLGDEKALGFSLSYDTNLLRFVQAVLGPDATNHGASLTVNANQTTNFGRIGLALSLDLFTTNTFPAGTNQIAELLFTPAPGITGGVSAIQFTNAPIVPEIADSYASNLTATYVSGLATVELNCAFSLGTNAAGFTAGGGTSGVTLGTLPECGWLVSNTNDWISITSPTNGTGDGTVQFAVAANAGLASRTGVVFIAGQIFTITQSGITCSYMLSTNAATHPTAAGTNSFALLTAAPCPWSVINSNSWIQVLSGTSGSGNGTITYAVEENASITPRSGTLIAGGQAFTITQEAIVCTYSLSASGALHSETPATNSFSVTTAAPCPWTVVNTNPWVSILSGGGPGSGAVVYAVDQSGSLTERTGTLVVGGQTFSITQQAVTCSFAVTPTNFTNSAAGFTNIITVTAPSPCPWTVENTNAWVAILSGSNGLGAGTVALAVGANPISLERTGTVVVAGQAVSIVQQGIACTFTVSPTRRTHGFGTASNSFTINAGTGCLWSVVNTNPWLTIVGSSTGSGTNTVGYLVAANPSPLERIGYLNIQGATLLITQRASTCTFTLAPTNLLHSSAGGSGIVSVTAGAGCAWSATTTNGWMALTGASGSGNGSFGVAVEPNWSASARTGSVNVAGVVLPVSQAAYAGGFVLRSLDVSVPGQVSLSVTGGPAGVWELQMSGDLTNWSKLADLTNSTGRVDLAVPFTVGSNHFFRALRP